MLEQGALTQHLLGDNTNAEQLMEAARRVKRGLATNGYGLASWLLNQGRREDSRRVAAGSGGAGEC
jgi:hypothetical protein